MSGMGTSMFLQNAIRNRVPGWTWRTSIWKSWPAGIGSAEEGSPSSSPANAGRRRCERVQFAANHRASSSFHGLSKVFNLTFFAAIPPLALMVSVA